MPEERKLVTVLFADVTGSTELGDSLDPEDVRALMGRYYEHARRVMDAHGGTLEKFIGDAVMAVFGLPQAHGDDAERALAAALALQVAVSGDDVLGEEFALRIGVNMGEVMATTDRTRVDFLVTGDAVNVAARIQQHAIPGEVLAGERVRASAQDSILFAPGRDVTVKGKASPLKVFPVIGPQAVRRVSSVPFVGREEDLLQLSLLQRRTVRERRPQLISIVAPAGTGKSRLIEEFASDLSGRGVRVATGRCVPYGEALTYWPLRGLLGNLLGEIERDRVVEVFTGTGHTQEDAGQLADLVLAPLGIESRTALDSQGIFNAWRILIESLAQQAPHVVVFEDLHWASDSLLDLVEFLMHPRTGAPLLVIACTRPELLDRRPSWGGGVTNITAVALQPLDDTQTAELVTALSDRLPASICRRIVERSGGNPFFATELVRGFSERTDMAERDDSLPDTVHGAVLARLDLLSRDERAVLQAASVVGRTFGAASVAAALEGMSAASVGSTLDSLLLRDLIVPSGPDGFTMRHVLIRDVAYRTLSRAERVRMHVAVGEWLESFAGDRLNEFVELIAYHYREAIVLSRKSSVLADAPVDPARAVSFLKRAGEIAARLGAFDAAHQHLQSAIDIAPPTEQVDLYETMGASLWGTRSLAALRSAYELWRSQGSRDALVGARLLHKIIFDSVRWETSAELIQPGLDELSALLAEERRLAELSGDEGELWWARGWESTLPRLPLFASTITRADVDQFMAVHEPAIAYFRKAGVGVAVGAFFRGVCVIRQMIGEHDRAVAAMESALSVATAPTQRAILMGWMLHAHFDAGRYERCISIARDALAEMRPGEPVARLGQPLSFAFLAAVLGGRWADVPDIAAALDDAWEQLHTAPGMGFVMRGHFAALHLALSRDDRGAAERAAGALDSLLVQDWRFAERALVQAYRDDDPGKLDLDYSGHIWARNLHTLALILMFFSERGRAAPATLLKAGEVHAQAQRVHVLVHASRIAALLANRDFEGLARAIDDAGHEGLVPHAARMRVVLAELTNRSADLTQVRDDLERLEDRQFLRRLETAAVRT